MFIRASYRILGDFFHNMKKADLQMFAAGERMGIRGRGETIQFIAL